jgi:hypothetical protein
MFPISFNKTIIVSSEGDNEIDTQEILMKFKEQFDDPGFEDPDTISFDNFSFFLKRHAWLTNGSLRITKKDNQVFADLNLRFYTYPVFFLLLSVYMLAIHAKNLQLAFLSVAGLWIFYAVLYMWTIAMFVITIKRTVRHELYLKHSGLDEAGKVIIVKGVCPGCGRKLEMNELECAECGLNFGGE